MDFSGKVVLITGGSRGIGRDIAVEFAKLGSNVIINYRNRDYEAKKTVDIVRNNGGYCDTAKCDVSDYKSVSKMIDEIVNKFGKIDVLVNNAGVSKIGLFIDMNEEDWDLITGTNLKGVFNTCHSAVKHMISRRVGCIINISSIWGEVGASCETAYSAAKGGINAFTKALAKELAPSGIRVNAISPGVIDTEMNKWLSDEEKVNLINEIPMMKFGDGKDIAKLATFLASENANYITAQVIKVDGGII